MKLRLNLDHLLALLRQTWFLILLALLFAPWWVALSQVALLFLLIACGDFWQAYRALRRLHRPSQEQVADRR